MLYDPAHSVNETFQKLPPRRHIKNPFAKKNLFKKSFIPSAVLILNVTE